MIIVMSSSATQANIEAVETEVQRLGFETHTINGVSRTVVAVVGDLDKGPIKTLALFEGVSKVEAISKPYKLAARSTKNENTIVTVGDAHIGSDEFVVFAGPCSVESEEQILESADIVKKYGAHILRGGAYKPRTSPYSFQGLEEEGLKLLALARETYGLPVITELLSVGEVDLVEKYSDVIQIGARNMQNFSLLKAVGSTKRPVFLKRGLSATLEELLMSAEYIMSRGNYQVILCERGIRTFEKAYRNTLDLNSVPRLKQLTHLPIIVDPSHGTGDIDLVAPMAKAAIGAGADGLMIEIHPNPAQAFSDGPQSLNEEQFKQLMQDIKPFVEAAGKRLTIVS